MRPLHFLRRDETSTDPSTPAQPPSPASYLFPLLLVLLICAGYLSWRRRGRDIPPGLRYVLLLPTHHPPPALHTDRR